VTGQIL